MYSGVGGWESFRSSLGVRPARSRYCVAGLRSGGTLGSYTLAESHIRRSGSTDFDPCESRQARSSEATAYGRGGRGSLESVGHTGLAYRNQGGDETKDLAGLPGIAPSRAQPKYR